jgi:hypothetical protein
MARTSEAPMSRISLGLLLGITLVAAGCGYNRNYMNGNGAPQITQLAPTTATAGGGAFALKVEGTGFGADSLVYWGTTTRTTAYDTASQVTAQIPAADIMNAGTVQVYVHSGGANSNAVTFTIQ